MNTHPAQSWKRLMRGDRASSRLFNMSIEYENPNRFTRSHICGVGFKLIGS